ncbi:Uncharacterized protein dnm_015350 [Desulfonema magnum]|uniref:Uncharacterized protein n=1 Tax=Desulfonema magnum TaxID=45655 RepID=A0A975BHW9_9BACT|nr:Uncharacterized protein dnm_015350 [Desulfonema magnum]
MGHTLNFRQVFIAAPSMADNPSHSVRKYADFNLFLIYTTIFLE